MKTAYLLLLSVCVSAETYAQEDLQAVRQWQSLHPNTLLISSERFNAFSDAERQLLGTDYIVFSNEITIEQLRQYEETKSGATFRQPDSNEQNASFIKHWLGMHPDMKILPHSYFSSLTTDQQSAYTENPSCIVLQGELLTVKDIELFEQH